VCGWGGRGEGVNLGIRECVAACRRFDNTFVPLLTVFAKFFNISLGGNIFAASQQFSLLYKKVLQYFSQEPYIHQACHNLHKCVLFLQAQLL
jgi:hypothetical protein